jgi:hypothetical protein
LIEKAQQALNSRRERTLPGIVAYSIFYAIRALVKQAKAEGLLFSLVSLRLDLSYPFHTCPKPFRHVKIWLKA